MRTPPNERLTSDNADALRPRRPEPAKVCPERRCILSGETAPRAVLLRLAISPDGDVMPDPQAKAPGRGAWIGVTRAELEAAIAKGRLRGALARAFKGAPMNVPDKLGDLAEMALQRSLLDRLGLEMRAGLLILGTERIAETARSGQVDLLLHASDASEDGRKKLDQAWRVGSDAEGSGKRGTCLPLDRAALSVALGRQNVVHLAVGGRGPSRAAAQRVELALERLSHFLGAESSTETHGATPDAVRLDDELNA